MATCSCICIHLDRQGYTLLHVRFNCKPIVIILLQCARGGTSWQSNPGSLFIILTFKAFFNLLEELEVSYLSSHCFNYLIYSCMHDAHGVYYTCTAYGSDVRAVHTRNLLKFSRV